LSGQFKGRGSHHGLSVIRSKETRKWNLDYLGANLSEDGTRDNECEDSDLACHVMTSKNPAVHLTACESAAAAAAVLGGSARRVLKQAA
jgi:hypothetical protein